MSRSCRRLPGPWRRDSILPLVATLLGQLEIPPAPTAKAEGPFAAVALEQGIDRLLDYAIPPKFRHALRVGQVVRVPLGRKNRTTRGYVVSIHPESDYPKIKPLSGIDDERVLVPPRLMQLALWMSRYYVAPLGTVLESVIPSAVKKKVGVGYSQVVRLAQPREVVQQALEKTRPPSAERCWRGCSCSSRSRRSSSI